MTDEAPHESTFVDDVRELALADAWVEYQKEHGYLTVPTAPDTGADFSAGFYAAWHFLEPTEQPKVTVIGDTIWKGDQVIAHTEVRP